MKNDPILIRKLPPTALIKHAVEVWPNRPDPESVIARQLHVGAMIWVRTRHGVKQRQVRLCYTVKGPSKHRGRHYVVAHDKIGLCHVHWLSDVIRVQPRLALGTGKR